MLSFKWKNPCLGPQNPQLGLVKCLSVCMLQPLCGSRNSAKGSEGDVQMCTKAVRQNKIDAQKEVQKICKSTPFFAKNCNTFFSKVVGFIII